SRRDMSVPLEIETAEYKMQCRVPTSFDLLEGCATSDSVESLRRELFERCILSVSQEGIECRPKEVPEEVVSVVARQLAESDPQGDTRLTLTCPECGTESKTVFDLAAFFWTEIEAWARRIVVEVHCIASAYGWSESDILSLSPFRRRRYLNLVGA